MFDISPIQIIIVLAIALLIFGPKRLPGLGRDLGRGIRDFKSGITGDDADLRHAEAATRASVAGTTQPTAEELIVEAATPESASEELEAAPAKTPAGS